LFSFIILDFTVLLFYFSLFNTYLIQHSLLILFIVLSLALMYLIVNHIVILFFILLSCWVDVLRNVWNWMMDL